MIEVQAKLRATGPSSLRAVPSRPTVLETALLAVLLGACGAEAPSKATSAPKAASPTGTPAVAGSVAVPAPSAPPAPPSSSAPTPPPTVSLEGARARLFPEGAAPSDDADACDDVRCLVTARYAEHPTEQALALSLWDDGAVVAGLEPGRRMDGGWRGMIDLVPRLPTGVHRRHLASARDAFATLGAFFDEVVAGAPRPVRYRWRGLELGYMESVGRTTPSAYARGWAIAYNVRGSLHRSPAAITETFFHELFHLNDADHDHWSSRVLTEPYETIVTDCTRAGRLSTPCLRPFAPHHTMVRGGTYYAFQPGNGVHEYAAELAVRYFDEQRGSRRGPPFKCGPAPNAEVWRALADEFFGGFDRTPACTPSRGP